MTKENEILSYMAKLGISREEAEQLYEDDQADYIGEDGEGMTEKAKSLKRYEKADAPKERKPRERKVDEEKAIVLDYLKKGLTLAIDSTTIVVENETKLHFSYNDNDYTVMLTRHRKAKA